MWFSDHSQRRVSGAFPEQCLFHSHKGNIFFLIWDFHLILMSTTYEHWGKSRSLDSLLLQTSYISELMGQTTSQPSHWLQWWTWPVIPKCYWLDVFLLDCHMAEIGLGAPLYGVCAQRTMTETSVARYDRLRVKMKKSVCVMGCSNWDLLQNTCQQGQILQISFPKPCFVLIFFFFNFSWDVEWIIFYNQWVILRKQENTLLMCSKNIYSFHISIIWNWRVAKGNC